MTAPHPSRRVVGATTAVLLGLVAAVLIVRPAAAAVPNLIRVANTSATNSSDSRTVTATCPPGSPQLLSAGYAIDGGLGDVIADDLHLFAGSATAFAYEADPDYVPSWSLTVYAVCATNVPDWGLISAEERAESPASARLTLACPTGDVLLGAGFVLNGATGEVEIDYQVPDGSTLTAPTSVETGAFEADPFAGDWWLATQAVCADPLPGLVRRDAVTGPAVIDFQKATATCLAGEVLVGSGWDLLGAATGEVIVDDVRLNGSATTPPTSVEVDAYREDAFTGSWSVQAYALCASA